MRCKKMIAIISMLVLISLLMITSTVQAATKVGKVYNLEVEKSNEKCKFTWSTVSNAQGYNIYVSTENSGYQYIGSVINNSATLIGFSDNTTYKIKVSAYNSRYEEGVASEEIVINYKEEEIYYNALNSTNVFIIGCTEGAKLNLKNPKTFTDKIQWLKLYDRNPIYTIMADKYRAKDYIGSQIGMEHIIPLLGVWDNAKDIDFDNLPNQFVLKCNHDSKSWIFC